MISYYDLLGVSKNATDSDIKKAFRALTIKMHPDKAGNTPEAEKKFQEIKKAYEVLSDPDKRKMYDKYGEDFDKRAFGGHGFGSGFTSEEFSSWGSSFFSSMFGFGDASESSGADLEAVVHVTLSDIANGSSQTISYDRYVQCSTCNGLGAKNKSDLVECNYCHGHGQMRQNLGGMIFSSTCGHCSGSGKKIKTKCSACSGHGVTAKRENITVDIPVGMPFNRRIKKQGMGHGAKNGRYGDLLISVLLKKSNDPFIRQNNDVDVLIELPINIVEASLGSEKSVPCVGNKNKEIKVKIPAGINHGEDVVIKGEGLPYLGDANRKGNMIIKIKIVVPKNLNNKQKELLREVEKQGSLSTEQSNTFWSKIFG